MKNYISQSKKVYSKMMEGEGNSEDVKEEVEVSTEIKESTGDIWDPEPKVVELDSNYEESEESEEISENNIRKITETVEEIKEETKTKNENNGDKYKHLEERLEKVEEIVKEIKYSMDILKGFGAIPPKMPNEEQQREIDERNKKLIECKPKPNRVKLYPNNPQIQLTTPLFIGIIIIVILLSAGTMEIFTRLRTTI